MRVAVDRRRANGHDASTYEAWKTAALEYDRLSGAERWKTDDHTLEYDYKVIRRRYDELVEIRASGDSQRLLFYLNEGLHGNMGGMGTPALYGKTRFGTKKLIGDYVTEVTAALQQFEAVDEREIDFATKLAVMRRAAVCFGRTALMLSGAGSLGPFHMGVVKALAERDLLPEVISGASAGSVVAAIIGTTKRGGVGARFAPQRRVDAVDLVADVQGVSLARRRVKVDDLRQLIEASIPDLTFSEALEESGRHINISVSPLGVQQRSRILNALTAPNAFIREAVLASCAIPGVFPPVTLAAKDVNGQRRPYVPTRKWMDGSMTDDLPARRLSRMYGINHFISSLANPLVLWAIRDPQNGGDLWARFMAIYQAAGREWMRALYPLAMAAVRDFYPLSMVTRMYFGVLTQSYTADINISPRGYDPALLLAVLTPEEASALVDEGERATWPKIEMIRNSTQISRTISAVLRRMEARMVAGA